MGLIKLTLLIVGLDNITRKLLTNFETNKFKTQRVTEFHVKKYKFFSFLGGKGGSDQTDTSLRGGAESHRETFDQLRKPYARNFVSYRVSRKKLKKYTSFFHFLGERGGPIKQTLLSGGVQNPPSKQLTNFEILKIKTRGVITQRETNKFRTQRVTEFHVKKYKFFSFFGGEGGVRSN